MRAAAGPLPQTSSSGAVASGSGCGPCGRARWQASRGGDRAQGSARCHARFLKQLEKSYPMLQHQTTCSMRKRVHPAINLSFDIVLFPKPIVLQNWPKLASSTFFQAYANGRRFERFRAEPQIWPTRCTNQISLSATAPISSPLAKRPIAFLFRQQSD